MAAEADLLNGVSETAVATEASDDDKKLRRL